MEHNIGDKMTVLQAIDREADQDELLQKAAIDLARRALRDPALKNSGAYAIRKWVMNMDPTLEQFHVLMAVEKVLEETHTSRFPSGD